MKTIYMLRIRFSDNEDWGEPEAFKTRKRRDHCASTNRIIGGIRTHSYEEKISDEEFAAKFSESE